MQFEDNNRSPQRLCSLLLCHVVPHVPELDIYRLAHCLSCTSKGVEARGLLHSCTIGVFKVRNVRMGNWGHVVNERNVRNITMGNWRHDVNR